jgi:hypothetical protein
VASAATAATNKPNDPTTEDGESYFGNLVSRILKKIQIKFDDISISYSIELDPMAGPVLYSSCSLELCLKLLDPTAVSVMK